MIMMCWFYCIPLAKGLFYASAPLIVLFSLFVLKRGIRQSRPGLRQLAFLFMFFALLKLFIVDAYLARDTILCDLADNLGLCNAHGFKMLQGVSLVLLALGGFLLFNLYRSFMQNRPQKHITPQQARLSLWANLSVSLVVMLILWLAAPWAGYLTVGHVPQFFMQVPWQHLAVLNIVVLLYGFWKLEDCIWTYDPAVKVKQRHQNVWTAKDTLWVSVVLFLIALAFSYASNDVLSSAMPAHGSHSGFTIDDVNIDNIRKIAPQFEAPQQ